MNKKRDKNTKDDKDNKHKKRCKSRNNDDMKRKQVVWHYILHKTTTNSDENTLKPIQIRYFWRIYPHEDFSRVESLLAEICI